MASPAARSCRFGVARQLAPLLKPAASLAALTDPHLQVYRSLQARGDMDEQQEREGQLMDSISRNNMKLLGAVIAGSGVIAMGALSVAISQEQSGQESAAKSTTMTIGSTSTETTPPTVEATTMAAPAMRGPAALPTEEQGPAAP
jgi:hypothetical protein